MFVEGKGSQTLGAQWLVRATIIMVADALLIALSFAFVLLLRFDFEFTSIDRSFVVGYEVTILPLIMSAIALMWWRGLYRSIWSFVSVNELIRLMEAWACEGVLVALAAFTFAPRMPASYWIGGTLLAFALTSGLRFSWRLFRLITSGNRRKDRESYRRVMVVGAGEAGRALIHEMNVTPSLGMRAICAIDDNPAKNGRLIADVPVVGNHWAIAQMAEKYDIDTIVVAIPSATGAQRKEIVEACQETGLDVRVIPGVYQLVDGKVSVSRLREINIEDLLGRDPVVVDGHGIHDLVAGRTVLVTGGGGSIGSEICRQVAREDPKQLVIFDIYENNAYAI